MFAATLGGQISWLIPFAVIAVIGTLILIGRRPRTDLARASVLLWAGWFALEFFVLSFQQGTQHPYYTSAMAPPIAALTGIGAVALYQAHRRSGRWSLVLALAIAGTGAWSFVLLRRTPGWNPWLPWVVAGATAVAVLALGFGWLGFGGRGRRSGGRALAVAGVAGLIAVLAGPAAYAVTPLARPIQGTNPLAGPTAGGGAGVFTGPAGVGGTFADRFGDRGAFGDRSAFGDRGDFGDFGRDGGRAGAGGAAAGGLGTASKGMITYLEAHRDGATWLVAVQGSSAAAAIILETGGLPVMAMGGFRGTDPAPTLAQFEQYVKQGKVHYVLAGGGRGGGGGFAGGGGFGGGGGVGGGGSSVGSVITWVEQNCTAVAASAYGGSAASSTSGAAGGLYRCG
jgi:4-amino-4-deoxy-L-arabinose transferase-like glycosyltransferase